MFILQSQAAIEEAIERARRFHLKVRMIEFGRYAVTASKGEHVVRCYRDGQGHKVVECDCPTKDGIACRCGVAALPLHIHAPHIVGLLYVALAHQFDSRQPRVTADLRNAGRERVAREPELLP